MLCACQLALAGNILVWMSFEVKSRVFRLKPLVLELAKRGHNVTWVIPNFVDADLHETNNLTLVTCPKYWIDQAFALMNTPEAFDGEYLDALNFVTIYSHILADVSSRREIAIGHSCRKMRLYG